MITDFRFTHLADIYVSRREQDENGEMVSLWIPVRTGEPCELHSDTFNSDTRYAIVTKYTDFEFPLLVFGRFKNDIRHNNGAVVPITSMMITNVRDECTGTPIFVDPSTNNSVLFELRSFQPFTNPWGQTEYYRTQAFRTQDQSWDNIGPGYVQ